MSQVLLPMHLQSMRARCCAQAQPQSLLCVCSDVVYVQARCVDPFPCLPEVAVIAGVAGWRHHLRVIVCKVGHVHRPLHASFVSVVHRCVCDTLASQARRAKQCACSSSLAWQSHVHTRALRMLDAIISAESKAGHFNKARGRSSAHRELGHQWRLQAPLSQPAPIQAGKPRMLLDLLCALEA